MRAFEVRLNGKKLCTAGVGRSGVLSAVVNWVSRNGKDDLFLEVGGLAHRPEAFVTWEGQKPLKVGDSIQIEILERRAVDRPRKRKRVDPRVQRREEEKYLVGTAKRLGWRIDRSKPK